MIPVRGYAGHKVAVLGLGRSGLPAIAALKAGDAQVIAWDDGEDARARAFEQGIEIVDLRRANVWDGVQVLIVSPGIAHLYPEPHPVVAAAWDAGVAVDNDVGLFFRSFADEGWDYFDRMPQVVCITGSNGKSTTTALLTHILKKCGRPVQMGGNIGRGVLDLEPAEEGMVVVLELSSYQTELARALQPDIAVFLNLSSDHLDRHGGVGGYFAAKRRLFTQGGPSRCIIGVDEKEGRFLANIMREAAGSGDPVVEISSGRKLSGPGWNVFARKGFLSERRNEKQMASIDLRTMETLPGAHNHQNACAAYAVARSLGLGPKPIEKAMVSYPGLAHRSQLVALQNGIRFINDSKATNAESAGKALAGFDRVRWIAGGREKEGGITSLKPLFGQIEKAYLLGEAAEGFAATLGDVPHVISESLEAATASAIADASEGETVLLAPACSSFDQFTSFEERGELFEALVKASINGD